MFEIFASRLFEIHEDHGVHSVLCQVEVVLLLVLLAAAAEEGDALDDKVDDPVEEVGLLQRAGPGLGVGQPHDLDLIGHPRVRREGDGGPHVPLPTSRVVAGDEVVALPLEKAVQRPRPLLRHLLQARPRRRKTEGHETTRNKGWRDFCQSGGRGFVPGFLRCRSPLSSLSLLLVRFAGACVRA